jgi:hypothetical protein
MSKRPDARSGCAVEDRQQLNSPNYRNTFQQNEDKPLTFVTCELTTLNGLHKSRGIEQDVIVSS